MDNLFYIIGLGYLIKAILSIYSPLNFYKTNKEFVELVKGKDEEKIKKQIGSIILKVLFTLSNLVWMFAGLLSVQWYLFLGLIVLGMIIGQVLKLSPNLNYKGFIISLGSVISSLIMGYAILNHFHHFNLITF